MPVTQARIGLCLHCIVNGGCLQRRTQLHTWLLDEAKHACFFISTMWCLCWPFNSKLLTEPSRVTGAFKIPCSIQAGSSQATYVLGPTGRLANAGRCGEPSCLLQHQVLTCLQACLLPVLHQMALKATCSLLLLSQTSSHLLRAVPLPTASP